MDKITIREMADALQIHYRKMLAVLAAGHITAQKSKGDKGRWVVLASDFAAFVKGNEGELAKLRKKYIALYRGALPSRPLPSAPRQISPKRALSTMTPRALRNGQFTIL